MILFQNTYNYFHIQLYRNYIPIMFNQPDLNRILKPYSSPLIVNKLTGSLSSIFLKNYSKKGRKTKFFYNHDFSNDSSDLMFSSLPNVITDKEDKLIKHYNNPFANVRTCFVERTLFLRNNKIVFRVVNFRKYREFNEKYYKKTYEKYMLTIDLDKGNIGLYHYLRKKDGKVVKIFRNNYFPILNFIVGHLFCSDHHNTAIKTNTAKQISADNLTLLSILRQYLPIRYNGAFDFNMINDAILQHFIAKRNIKVPNKYEKLIMEHYPTEKVLVKNDRKLVKSILVKHGIYSKITNKILHKYPNISPKALFVICSIFGDDYIKYISQFDDKFFQILSLNPEIGEYNLVNHNFMVFNHEEKTNIVKIFKSLNTENLINVLTTLFDQMRMLKKMQSILKYKHLTAKTIKELNRQHNKLSELYTKFSKGFENYIIYDKKVISQIEEQIRVNHDGQLYIFKPVVLKNSNEYIEEGSYMRHCVASYDERDSSMIVSLRLDGDEERVTCEFEKESGMNRQAKYFHNQTPPEYFKGALEVLNRKMYDLGKKDLLYHKDIVTKNVEFDNSELTNLEL